MHFQSCTVVCPDKTFLLFCERKHSLNHSSQFLTVELFEHTYRSVELRNLFHIRHFSGVSHVGPRGRYSSSAPPNSSLHRTWSRAVLHRKCAAISRAAPSR